MRHLVWFPDVIVVEEGHQVSTRGPGGFGNHLPGTQFARVEEADARQPIHVRVREVLRDNHLVRGETPDCPTAESTAARRNSRRPWAITTALTFIPRFLRLQEVVFPGSLFMLPPEARRAMRAPVSRSDWDDHPR